MDHARHRHTRRAADMPKSSRKAKAADSTSTNSWLSELVSNVTANFCKQAAPGAALNSALLERIVDQTPAAIGAHADEIISWLPHMQLDARSIEHIVSLATFTTSTEPRQYPTYPKDVHSISNILDKLPTSALDANTDALQSTLLFCARTMLPVLRAPRFAVPPPELGGRGYLACVVGNIREAVERLVSTLVQLIACKCGDAARKECAGAVVVALLPSESHSTEADLATPISSRNRFHGFRQLGDLCRLALQLLASMKPADLLPHAVAIATTLNRYEAGWSDAAELPTWEERSRMMWPQRAELEARAAAHAEATQLSNALVRCVRKAPDAAYARHAVSLLTAARALLASSEEPVQILGLRLLRRLLVGSGGHRQPPASSARLDELLRPPAEMQPRHSSDAAEMRAPSARLDELLRLSAAPAERADDSDEARTRRSEALLEEVGPECMLHRPDCVLIVC